MCGDACTVQGKEDELVKLRLQEENRKIKEVVLRIAVCLHCSVYPPRAECFFYLENNSESARACVCVSRALLVKRVCVSRALLVKRTARIMRCAVATT